MSTNNIARDSIIKGHLKKRKSGYFLRMKHMDTKRRRNAY